MGLNAAADDGSESLVHPDRKVPLPPLDEDEDLVDNMHFREIIDYLKVDKRFHVLTCFAAERQRLILDYVEELRVRNGCLPSPPCPVD